MLFDLWLYLSCQELHDLEDVIAHPLVICRKQRETLGAANDAAIYSQGNLACIPKALRPNRD